MCLFLLDSGEQIFERPTKMSSDGTGMPKFLDTMFVHFWSVGKHFRRMENYSLWPQSYAVSEYRLRNWVSIFVREKWGNLWRAYKIGLDYDQTGFLLTHINPFAKVLKITGVGDFVERTFLHKTWYHTKL